MNMRFLFPNLARGPIDLEQAVYGSFAFWDRGYAFLAHSPGCRAEWLKDLSAACQRFGERPPGAVEVTSTLALRLPSGPWAIVQAQPQGADDRGRPGAMAFHAILVPHRDYARAGGDPFAYEGLFRSSWTAASESEPLGTIRWWPPDPPGPHATEPHDPRAEAIAQAIRKGKRVAVESADPIEGLAREVWMRLPPRARRRASLATWAFGNGNRFDMLAVPRLAAAVLDRSYLDPADPRLAAPEAPAEAEAGPATEVEVPLHVHEPTSDEMNVIPVPPVPARRPYGLQLAAGAAVILGALAWTIRPRVEQEPASAPASSGAGAVSRDVAPGPASGSDAPPIAGAHRRPLSDRDLAAAHEALTDLADRLRLLRPDDPESREPGPLLERIVASTKYRGEILDASSLDDLRARPDDPDAARLLEWHRMITSRFLDDRPLPPDFASGPLPWQIDVALWSFHGAATVSERTPAERATALADLLRLDRGPTLTPGLVSNPIAVSYAAFLERLPRR